MAHVIDAARDVIKALAQQTSSHGDGDVYEHEKAPCARQSIWAPYQTSWLSASHSSITPRQVARRKHQRDDNNGKAK